MNRSPKEIWLTKEIIIKEIDGLEVSEYNLLGRSDQSLVYRNNEGLSVVINVVCKRKEFDAQAEVDKYTNRHIMTKFD